MMEDRHARTRLLVGEAGLARLREAAVAVVGLGGVGGYAVEALARAGVGGLVLVDFDTVAPSNLNRQLLATEATLGRRKAEVAAERVASIDPACRVVVRTERLTAENAEGLLGGGVTHVVDAIDDVAAKTALLALLHARGLPHAACMGAGGLAEPTGIAVADIARTEGCPLARAVRLRLRRMGVARGIRCVYTPRSRLANPAPPAEDGARRPQGTLSFMPGLIGLTAAGVILNDIAGCAAPGGLLE